MAANPVSNVIRISDPDQVRPSHVVLVCLVCATLAGVFLLTGGAHRDVLHDGAVEWGADSPLRAMVEVLNLQFSQTTSKGVAIKSLVFGMGTAGAVLVLGLVLGIRPRSGDEVFSDDLTPAQAAALAEGESTLSVAGKKHVPLLAAGQLMMLAYAVWSFASVGWSKTPSYAVGGAILLGIQMIWAFVLGLGLNRTAARAAAWSLVVVCLLTAGLAIAYHAVRNPTLRASYPIGNPLLLAACLMPGILIALAVLAGAVESMVTRRGAGQVWLALAALLIAGVLMYAFGLTRSRGPLLGVLAGAGAMLFFALAGRARIVVGVIGVLAMLAAGLYFTGQSDEFSATGRSATIRLRLLAWGYAFDLAVDSPLTGQGQGGYCMLADAKAGGEDALADPAALNARVAHAHSEWMEIWADLGSIGLVLAVGAILLTLWSGAQAISRLPTLGLRWVMIGLLGSLVGLVVEEATNVGLRLPGLPAVFFTVIGLIWAMCDVDRPAWIGAVVSTRPGRAASLLAALVVAVGVGTATARDFLGARAEFEVFGKLQALEGADAVRLADRARKNRLNPQDRLVASGRLCAVLLSLSQTQQEKAFRQATQAQAQDPPDGRLLQLATQSRDRSRQFAQAGLGELGGLLKASPDFWNSGLWEHGFYRIQADFDRAVGNVEGAERNLAAAAAGMEREIRRRPYDSVLAATYASALGQQVDLAKLFEVMARPLRHSPTPSAYLNVLTQLAQNPGFNAAFGPLHDELALNHPLQANAERWSAMWVPEKLRLSAVILFSRGLPESVELELTRATEFYSLIHESAPMGSAACFAELADARYFAHPDDPSGAIEAAGRAIELTPSSQQGRYLRNVMRSRMVTYHLAAGDEAAALELLEGLIPGAVQDALPAEMGARLSRIAHNALQRDPAVLPVRFAGWVERAITLNPDYLANWEEEESATLLEAAIQAGADMRVVLEFLEGVLTNRPGGQEFQALRIQLRQALGLPDEPIPTSGAATSGKIDPPPDQG